MTVVPGRAGGQDRERPTATLLEDVQEEVREQVRHANTARWRAGALAEAIFGAGVVPRLRYARGASGFQALVELQVPFRCLESHREREGRFLWEAGRDEVLARIPTLFVFTPGEGVR